MPEANWFLGIRIVRDRAKRLLWLCQDSYIDKISNRFNTLDKVNAVTPLSDEPLLPYLGQSTAGERHGYQSRVGSINFAAVITRQDVAKASSNLSQHLTNPGPVHLKAADRVLAYLERTKFLAIQYGGVVGSSQSEAAICGEDFQACLMEAFSDATFADNNDRKSSQGYLFTLASGPIDWKASKQQTVTTSSTEAELLALSTMAKESIAWQRFFNHLPDQPVEGAYLLYCDNQQTIRLLDQEEPLLTTKLRHVDIHQHWLRQEVQNGAIDIDWVPTFAMKADGLTKPLPPQLFQRFIHQLNLVDIQGVIDPNRQALGGCVGATQQQVWLSDGCLAQGSVA
jgi:hypothetical protein